MASLNVVCLISGGKDSLFSILHCLENGHNVVALANLYPPLSADQKVVDDTDSYMYQTIGHTVIPLYEQALGLPLYRREISGTAAIQDRCYNAAGGGGEDETEAMVPLLQKVKARHPEVNAISTGAILSDYQRTRVESVALRLGLTPLSFLWQYPSLPPESQISLLEDMAAVGQDARIIKVASGGLDETYLWQNVADHYAMARIDRAVKRFGANDGGAVLGEGGEFETLAVAGPAPLWKGSIVVGRDQRDVVSGEAGTAFIRLKKAQFEPYLARPPESPRVRIPPLLSHRCHKILDDLCKADIEVPVEVEEAICNPGVNSALNQTPPVVEHPEWNPPDPILHEGLLGNGVDAAAQMRSIMDHVVATVRQCGQTCADIAYTSIILRSMSDFASVNAIYGRFFTEPNPPARVTLACANVLPYGKFVMLSATMAAAIARSSKRGLHVQSRSYWAPANIGPYSQAIGVPYDQPNGSAGAVVYIAGQIPLIPASMELVRDSVKDAEMQTVLAMQHFLRVGQAMQVQRWICGMAFITADSQAEAKRRLHITNKAWKALHRTEPPNEDTEEDAPLISNSFDIWDLRNGAGRTLHGQIQEQTRQSSFANTALPPLHVVQVDALPRGASVEWAVYGDTTDMADSPSIMHYNHLLHVFRHHIVH